MPFDVPNVSTAAFGDQARLFSQDLDILAAALDGTGVVSGCAVTAQGTPDMTVAVAAGTIKVSGGADVAVTAGNVTITAAHATLPRIDMVVSSSAGVLSATAGTAASAPEPAAIPASSVVLAFVYVPAADTAINTNQIVDKRAKPAVASATPADPFGWGFPVSADPAGGSATVAVDANTAKFFRVIGSGTITKIGISVVNSAGNISVGVYASSGSGKTAVPGTRKATSGSVVCPAAGYAEVSLGGSVVVNAGDWFAISASAAATFLATPGSGVTNDLAKGRGMGYNASAAHPLADPAPALTWYTGQVFILVGVA